MLGTNVFWQIWAVEYLFPLTIPKMEYNGFRIGGLTAGLEFVDSEICHHVASLVVLVWGPEIYTK